MLAEPGVVTLLTYVPGCVLLPTIGSGAPAGEAGARCRPVVGHDPVPVFLKRTVRSAFAAPGGRMIVGLAERETNALPYCGMMCHHVPRRPVDDAGHVL